jgi:hypothetical protein
MQYIKSLKLFVLFLLISNNIAYSQEIATALDFDGINDYVNIPDNDALDVRHDFTIEALIKWDGGNTGVVHIISKWGGGGNASYILGLNEGEPRGWVHNGTSNDSVFSTTALPINTWTHLAFTRSSRTNQLRLYVDGTLVNTKENGLIPMNSSRNMTIGSENNTTGKFFDGAIDEIRIWSVAQTAQQIQNYQGCQVVASCVGGLVAQYNFNQHIADGNNAGQTSLRSQTSSQLNGQLHHFSLSGNHSNWTVGDTNASSNCDCALSMAGGLHFDGVDDIVKVPVSSRLDIDTNQLTLEAWVKLEELPSQLNSSFASIYDSPEDAYILYLDRSRRELRFKLTDADGTAARVGIPEASLSLNTWMHIAGVYQGNNAISIYLNGSLINTINQPGLNGNVKSGQHASIGAQLKTGSGGISQ